MHFHFHALRTKQTKTLATGFSNPPGYVTLKRIEWGIGKGGWKREIRKTAKCLGMTGKLSATYFVIGSLYKGEFRGSMHAAEALYRVA
jgi:hypothetical protein